MSINRKLLEQGALQILKGMGVDLNDSNFKDTPKRVAKMYAELLTPSENNWTTFPSPTQGMIILRNHRVHALCPHHLLPVQLAASVAYIPNKKVLGLSKLARAVESQLTTPIMQEELGERTVEKLMEVVEPQGAAVVLAGQHGCMICRGIETTGDVVTSALRGLFIHSISTREEFLRLIGRP